jgi:general secretion pathway protein A
MYEVFYNLSADPFRMSPDYHFAYPHRSYQKARDYLEYGLLKGEGLVVVTGIPGTGKSTVIHDLLAQYEDQDIVVTKIVTTQVEVDDLLRLLAYSFSIDAENRDKATLLRRIEEFLNLQYEAGRRVLLIIDEAQNLSERALEELRLLTNIQQADEYHLQMFLLGQPSLKDLIRRPGMEQFRQRLIATCHFEPLDVEETQAYVAYRLTVAGWMGDPEFSDRAFELIQHYSGGIPRRINLICGRLLLHGRVNEKHFLGEEDVLEVIEELPPEMQAEVGDLQRGISKPRPSDTMKLELKDKPKPWQDTPKQTRVSQEKKSVVENQPNSGQARTAPTLPNPPKVSSQANRVRAVATPAPLPHQPPFIDVDTQGSTAPDTDTLLDERHPRPYKVTRNSLFESVDKVVPFRNTEDDNYPTLPNVLGVPESASISEERLSQRPRLARRRFWVSAILIFALVLAAGYVVMVSTPNELSRSLKSFVQSQLSKPSEKEPQLETFIPMTDRGELNFPSTVTEEIESEINRFDLSEKTSETQEPKESARSTSVDKVIESAPNHNVDTQKPRDRTTDNSLSKQKELVIEEAETVIPMKSKSQPPKPEASAKVSRLGLLDPGVVVEGGRRVISGTLVRALRFYSNKVDRLSNGNVKVTLDREVPFKPRGTQITGGGQRELDIMAFVLRNYEGFDVHVIYHASADETEVTSALIKRRTQAIARYLIVQGLPAAHVRVNGRGILDHPASAPKHGSRIHSKQRIELLLKPIA